MAGFFQTPRYSNLFDRWASATVMQLAIVALLASGALSTGLDQGLSDELFGGDDKVFLAADLVSRGSAQKYGYEQGLTIARRVSMENGKCVLFTGGQTKTIESTVGDIAVEPLDIKRASLSSRNPEVSIQVVTLNRPGFLRHALQLISQQDVPYSVYEVVVVDDSPTRMLDSNLLAGLDVAFAQACLRYIYLEEHTSIGEKRNIATACSRGDVIMHWDDDDYYGPTRISSQSAPILSHQVDVTLVPLRWTFHARDAYGPSGFYETIGDNGGDMCSLTYRRSIWDADDATRQYPNASLMEDLYFYRNINSIHKATTEIIKTGVVDFVYVKHKYSSSAVPRTGRLASNPPGFLPPTTLQFLQRVSDESLPDPPEQTIVDQVNQELNFLPMYWKSSVDDLQIPQKYFTDIAAMIPMIPSSEDRDEAKNLLSENLYPGLHRLDGNSFTMAAWCCSTTRVPISNLIWARIVEIIPRVVDELSPSGLAMLAYVVGRVHLKNATLNEIIFSRVRKILTNFGTRDVVNLLLAMARLHTQDQATMIKLMLLYQPTEFSCDDWIRLSWSVYRLQPEWAKQGYFPRFLATPPAITNLVFDKLETLARNANAQLLHKELPIILLHAFATPEECRQLISVAKTQGWESTRNTIRTVRLAVLEHQESQNHPIVVSLQTRAAALAGLSRSHCESLNCVMYSENEQHLDHFDYVQAVDVEHAMKQADPLVDSMLMGGQRHCTVLIYLNSLGDDQGGATVFPNVGVRVRPQQGAALIWPNIGRDGKPNPLTTHHAERLIGARKFVANAWLRSEEATLMHQS